MALEIDLDVLRAEREAARREETKEPPIIRIAGELFELPLEIPLDLAWQIEEGLSKRGTMRALLGEVGYEKFMATNPSVSDWNALDRWLTEVYYPSAVETTDHTRGESEASGASSPSTSRRSRPTSKGSTR